LKLTNCLNFSIKTSLHITAEYGHVNNLRLLLCHEARIDVRDGLGFSALDLAVKGGHIECATALKTAQATHEASIKLKHFTDY
jgi:ankyrin repeat protein